jgi:hypothetical protein
MLCVVNPSGVVDMDITEQERQAIELNRQFAQAKHDEVQCIAAAVAAYQTLSAAYEKRYRLDVQRAQAMGLPVPEREGSRSLKGCFDSVTFHEAPGIVLLLRGLRSARFG